MNNTMTKNVCYDYCKPRKDFERGPGMRSANIFVGVISWISVGIS